MCSKEPKQLAYGYLTRIQSFSAAHRLNNVLFDEQTNKRVFGKCNNSHGHNYKMEVTVKGVIDAMTGMIINFDQLKQIISETVMLNLDHKNIDLDVQYFRDNNIISTAENLSCYIWKLIEQKLPSNVKLHCIKIYETDNNFIEYRGEFGI